MKQKPNTPTAKILPFQESLRPAIAPIIGNKDYAELERLLTRTDRILKSSGVESRFLDFSMEVFEAHLAKKKAAGKKGLAGPAAMERYQRHSRLALRCTVLKNLVGVDYREMSAQLALSPFYRWFCGVEDFAWVRVPSKSRLQGYAHWLPVEKMESLLDTLTEALRDEGRAKIIGLEHELDMAVVWVDSTCLKANIHFPVDWVLLRDGLKTLTASIETIRRHGLLSRIPEPMGFVREINGYCMAMTAAGKKRQEGKRERKRVFRAMKRLSKVVLKHAERYRALLDKSWEETDLSRAEAEVILRTMDNVIGKLPEACRQAHERVIGGRKVPSDKKILSFYESDVHVIVRGKAEAMVEFGNSLLLGETSEGYILDHELKKDRSKGDAQWLKARYEGMKEKSGYQLCGVVGDRGFASNATERMLEKDDVFNGLCPKNPLKLAQRMEEEDVLVDALRRRGQTEGRVGILKNVFLNGTPRAKGFKNRQLQVAWAVLAHNLWVVARLPWAEEKQAVGRAA